ncbi:hypothetical protein ABVC46_01755 [Lactobacillus crispatus]|jgi:hypothetical protein|uniref:Uncharacterized protein n=1 Tax=Lactobacillus crispatus TaxID=47770 RepID=A0AAW8WLT1_9LACO|nr:hypothetical protein [Lactobacillus crispatus]MCT7696524.1 hypothetical protein [Lactobacillus crispatus]MCT7707986.1 hypothetical protein [Lactobacillus crispatus]MCZ3784563.1 hypothetical protein [Lactobacillus crispatus]MCZ3792187.1 hypothetical protein [Lactobacillus crispatus]MDT9609348.1 hypothetical protein [Lactobacillus crispatus]
MRRNTITWIIIGAVFVLAFILGLSWYQNKRQQDAIRQEKIAKIQKEKRDEIHFHNQVNQDLKKTKDTVPSSQAQRNVNKAISLGLKAVTVSQTAGSDTMDLNNLSDDFKSDLSNVYKDTEALQDFNDIVNVTSDEGIVVHGDHDGMKKEAVPKPGTKYKVNNAEIEQSDQGTDDDNYRFNVNLQYQPNGFNKIKVSMSFVVDSFSGKISSVTQTSVN